MSVPACDDHNHKLYIETVGCQMNMLDSELVVAALRKQGYELTSEVSEADTVLFNTCSVREHAEHKIYSALGRLKFSKRQRPSQVIGVIGCMAQKDQQLIFQRAPHVDMVVGTGQLAEIPQLIEQSRAKREQRLAVSLGRKDAGRQEVSDSFQSYDPARDPEMRPSPFQAFVRIMIGCDKFCTYCVVPMTRGPEQSRPPEHIASEVRKLADEGVKEVTLLGQTVNSYKHRDGERTTRLSDLITLIHDTPGLERIKFVTNYPRDMTDDLLEAVRDFPKVARYLHVPAQSGCNDVLKRMKRGYTVEQYDEMMHRIRDIVPDCAVSSDFIVGFCGETEESFQKSLEMVRRWRFKNSFIFKYSPRPGTKADELMQDDVPEEVKRRRNNEMLALQNEIAEEDNALFIGRDVEVLVEGPSKWASKTPQHPAAMNGFAPEGAADGSGASSRHDPHHHDHDHDHDHDNDHGRANDERREHTATVTPHGMTLVPLTGLAATGGESCGDAGCGSEPVSSHRVQLVGRSKCDRIVVFDGNPRLSGTITRIAIYDCTPTTLLGSIVTHEVQHGSSSLLPILV